MTYKGNAATGYAPISGNTDTTTGEDGTFDFTVTAGGSTTLTIPYDAQLKIEETTTEYSVSTASDEYTDADGVSSDVDFTIAAVTEDGTVTFTNTRALPAPTGVGIHKNIMAYVLMFIAGLCIVFIPYRKRMRFEPVRRNDRSSNGRSPKGGGRV